jgi:hypothetical protein
MGMHVAPEGGLAPGAILCACVCVCVCVCVCCVCVCVCACVCVCVYVCVFLRCYAPEQPNRDSHRF